MTQRSHKQLRVAGSRPEAGACRTWAEAVRERARAIGRFARRVVRALFGGEAVGLNAGAESGGERTCHRAEATRPFLPAIHRLIRPFGQFIHGHNRLAQIALLCGGLVVYGFSSAGSANGQEPACESDSTSISHLEGNLQALDSLFARMARLKAGSLEQVNVVHLGDSHVQGGVYPETVRKSLQHTFGSAGRGLIVPLRLMGTNEPSNYAITSPESWQGVKCIQPAATGMVGLSGIAVSTAEKKLEFTITSTGEPFNKVIAFHHSEAPLLRATPEQGGELECSEGNTLTSTQVPLNTAMEQATLRAEVTDPLFANPTFYGFSLENGERGMLYHSIGVNGNYFQALVRNPQMVEQLAELHPDLFIISLGTNDSFGKNFNAVSICNQIEQLIVLFRKYHPDTPLLLTTPMACCQRVKVKGKYRYKFNANTIQVRDGIIRLATTYEIPYWDFYTLAGGDQGMEQWYEKRLAQADHIHLTAEGYQIQGQWLSQAILEAYNNYNNRTATWAQQH